MSLIPPNLVDGFGLLIYNEFPSCRLPSLLVQHTLKKAINPEAMLYKVSEQFRMQDYEEVTDTTQQCRNALHLAISYCFWKQKVLSAHSDC